MKRKELRMRIITGLVVGAVIIGCALLGEWPLRALLMVIAALCAFELYGLLVSHHGRVSAGMFTIFSLLPFLIYFNFPYTPKYVEWPYAFIMLLPLMASVYFILYLRGAMELQMRRLKTYGLGLLFIIIPIIIGLELLEVSTQFILGIFILLWTSDISAYFVGSSFGKRRLAPVISPGKTWEGVFGAVVFTLGVAYVLSMWLTDIGWRDWLVNGILVVIFGTIGDLFQSSVKRVAGAKDSGKLLPGHGGAWDRFDSLLGCLPWIGAYNLLI